MATTSNRGKTAEILVRKRLEVLCKSQTSMYMRLPDAHAGSLASTISDFLVLIEGQVTFLEVKETMHDYRLPHGNFDTGQVARMRMAQMAGARALVLIYHSGIKLWRGYQIDRFIEREGGSWDLREQTPTKLDELL